MLTFCELAPAFIAAVYTYPVTLVNAVLSLSWFYAVYEFFINTKLYNYSCFFFL